MANKNSSYRPQVLCHSYRFVVELKPLICGCFTVHFGVTFSSDEKITRWTMRNWIGLTMDEIAGHSTGHWRTGQCQTGHWRTGFPDLRLNNIVRLMHQKPLKQLVDRLKISWMKHGSRCGCQRSTTVHTLAYSSSARDGADTEAWKLLRTAAATVRTTIHSERRRHRQSRRASYSGRCSNCCEVCFATHVTALR